jgi:very-short-patch-repair endonuclease
VIPFWNSIIREQSTGGQVSYLARDLRKRQTPAERIFWKLLRDRRLKSLKFRRQFPIGPFVADFCCHAIRLVIELDGDVHAEAQPAARDCWRFWIWYGGRLGREALA